MEEQRMNEQFLVSINDGADILGLGRNKLREMIKVEPDIPVVKVGMVTKVILPSMKEWIVAQADAGRVL